jgi:epoxide hydrolase-like predicted phosphatase
MIKGVIFDWGGVLIDHSTKIVVDYCANKLNVEPLDLAYAYCPYDESIQKGEITESELWKKVSTHLNIQPLEYDILEQAFEKAHKRKPEMIQLIDDLKTKGYKTALLSNTLMPMVNFYHKHYDGILDETVFSCVEGLMKPNELLYKITLEKVNFKPEETLFIDDKLPNIFTARHIGMNTIHFKNSEQAIKDIYNSLKYCN